MKTERDNLYFQMFLAIFFLTELVKSETVKCPRYCTCYFNVTDHMRSVACIDRRLDNIDLAVPKRVQTLDLSNNSISSLEDRGFQNLGLIDIVNLILRHNSIRAISLHSFAGLMYLNRVDLSGNNLYQILPWTFHDNSNLKFISLSGNPLGHITTNGPLLDIPSLEVLELRHCSFGYFSEDAFSALPNLKKLDISNNQLISFDLFATQFLHNLQEMDVSKNPWPCNANLRSLKEFLKSKSCNLIESSCGISNEVTSVENKQPMFEKIISVVAVDPDYEDFGSSEETNNNAEVEVLPEDSKVNKCECPTEKSEPILGMYSLILPPIWLIFLSFQSGVCVTLFLGYICIYYCSRGKKKYEPLESQLPQTVDVSQVSDNIPEVDSQSVHSSTDSFVCPDTPPPSYRELYTS